MMRWTFVPAACCLAACAGGSADKPSSAPVTIVDAPAKPVVAVPPSASPSSTSTPSVPASATSFQNNQGVNSGGSIAPVLSSQSRPFETRVALTFKRHTASSAWNINDDETGGHRFEVRHGDVAAGDPSSKERAELASNEKLEVAVDYSLTFRFQVDPSSLNDAEWMTVVQIQSTFDPGEAGHSPPIAIEMVGHHMRTVVRYCTETISDNFTFVKVYEDTSDIEYGRWYNMRMDFRVDPLGAGSVKIWRNDVQVGSYNGALGFNDIVGPIIKQGIYRAAATTPFALRINDFVLRR
jgi:hypothetical protein